jgi:hypothetical protein
MDASNRPSTPSTSGTTPGSTPVPTPGATNRLEGRLLDRVREAYWGATEADEERQSAFLLAVGALAVYARACRIPVEELLHALRGAMEPGHGRPARADGHDPAARLRGRLRAQAEHAATSNYYRAD